MVTMYTILSSNLLTYLLTLVVVVVVVVYLANHGVNGNSGYKTLLLIRLLILHVESRLMTSCTLQSLKFCYSRNQ